MSLAARRTDAIDGLAQDETQALLGFLITHSIKSEFQYQQQWDLDTRLMWDNRCVQHFAQPTFFAIFTPRNDDGENGKLQGRG